MNNYRVAIDIGGTFTDVVVADAERGVVGSAKILTTPTDPANGFMEGLLQALTTTDVDPSQVAQVIHATTLVTNALIERKGGPAGLIVTEGFRDSLELRTETRYDLYDLHLRLPAPLVPRYLRLDVPERLDADGTVVKPIDLDAAMRAVRTLVEEHEVAALGICLLHAHVNPVHEERLRDAVRSEYPSLPLSLSSDVAPFIREYARTSTTAANAYVQPITGRYLNRIRQRLVETRLERARTYLMLSHGGLTDLGSGAEVPIRLCESGPAAGVVIGANVARSADLDRAISFDMGGTTAKICAVIDGVPLIGRELEVAHESRFMAGSGLPLSIQSVQLLEIGAGGGSIAGLDATGLLEVGPRSAGSEPGPACYGLGGTGATVTDANAVLGHLPRHLRLGGQLPLDVDAAVRAFLPLAEHFGQTPQEVARAVFDLVNEKMALAVRRHLVEQGYEPAAFTLVATGGAGPLHACAIAESLGLPRVIIPHSAGVGSAVGLLMAKYVVERSRSRPVLLADAGSDYFTDMFKGLASEAERAIDASFGADYAARYFIDARYKGQGYEMTVEIAPQLVADADLPAAIAAQFAEAYRLRFGRQLVDWPIEVLAYTVRLESATAGAAAQDSRWEEGNVEPVEVWSGAGWQAASARPWLSLPLADVQAGPLIVTDANTTVLVPAGWTVRRLPTCLDLRRQAGGEGR